MHVHIELPLDPNTGVAITTAITTSSVLHSLSTGTMTSVRPEQSDASTPPLPHFRGRGAADGTVCGDEPGWCPGVAVDVAGNGGADVAAGVDDEDVGGRCWWRCGGRVKRGLLTFG